MRNSNWTDSALCANSDTPNIWFSYDIIEIDYAKEICKICPVKVECFMSAWSRDDYYGIHGGISEFDFLMITWKEAKNVKQSNRSRSDSILKRILQKIK